MTAAPGRQRARRKSPRPNGPARGRSGATGASPLAPGPLYALPSRSLGLAEQHAAPVLAGPQPGRADEHRARHVPDVLVQRVPGQRLLPPEELRRIPQVGNEEQAAVQRPGFRDDAPSERVAAAQACRHRSPPDRSGSRPSLAAVGSGRRAAGFRQAPSTRAAASTETVAVGHRRAVMPAARGPGREQGTGMNPEMRRWRVLWAELGREWLMMLASQKCR